MPIKVFTGVNPSISSKCSYCSSSSDRVGVVRALDESSHEVNPDAAGADGYAALVEAIRPASAEDTRK